MALSPVSDNRRNSRRFRTEHPAKIMLGLDGMISCTVEDISTGGARLALKAHIELPETFELFIAAHDLQVRRARVCWRDAGIAGVAFECDEDKTTLVVDMPHLEAFEVCRGEATMQAHLAAAPARRQLKLYSTTA